MPDEAGSDVCAKVAYGKDFQLSSQIFQQVASCSVSERDHRFIPPRDPRFGPKMQGSPALAFPQPKLARQRRQLFVLRLTPGIRGTRMSGVLRSATPVNVRESEDAFVVAALRSRRVLHDGVTGVSPGLWRV